MNAVLSQAVSGYTAREDFGRPSLTFILLLFHLTVFVHEIGGE